MTNNPQRENNTRKEQSFQLMLPMDIEIKIDTDASVRLLLEITERMDYSKLNAAYKSLSNIFLPLSYRLNFRHFPAAPPSAPRRHHRKMAKIPLGNTVTKRY